jgi:hypothetical protein
MYCVAGGTEGRELCWEIRIEMLSVLCTLACPHEGQIYAGFAPFVGGCDGEGSNATSRHRHSPPSMQ